jgi:uncharacterized protein YjiS (DUF1127 family)
MSQHILTIHHNFMMPVIEGLIDLVKRIKQNRKKARDIRATIKELSSLSNRELNDLGIYRGEIYTIAQQTADRVYDTNKNLKGWV